MTSLFCREARAVLERGGLSQSEHAKEPAELFKRSISSLGLRLATTSVVVDFELSKSGLKGPENLI